MRPSYLILGLLVLSAVIGIAMSGDPERAGQLSEVRRSVAFTGETRDLALLVGVVVIGGFIAYLTLSRR